MGNTNEKTWSGKISWRRSQMKKCSGVTGLGSPEITFDRSYKVSHCNCRHNMMHIITGVENKNNVHRHIYHHHHHDQELHDQYDFVHSLAPAGLGLTQPANTLLHCQWFILTPGICICFAPSDFYLFFCGFVFSCAWILSLLGCTFLNTDFIRLKHVFNFGCLPVTIYDFLIW